MKNGEIEKLAVAIYVWKEKHEMDHKPVLLKQASNKQELTNWENIMSYFHRSVTSNLGNLLT
jgi:hypothetical protein